MEEDKQAPSAEDEEIKRVMGFKDFTTSKYKDHTASSAEAVFQPNTRKFGTYANRNSKPKK